MGDHCQNFSPGLGILLIDHWKNKNKQFIHKAKVNSKYETSSINDACCVNWTRLRSQPSQTEYMSQACFQLQIMLSPIILANSLESAPWQVALKYNFTRQVRPRHQKTQWLTAFGFGSMSLTQNYDISYPSTKSLKTGEWTNISMYKIAKVD
jgi:hypothetical protein